MKRVQSLKEMTGSYNRNKPLNEADARDSLAHAYMAQMDIGALEKIIQQASKIKVTLTGDAVESRRSSYIQYVSQDFSATSPVTSGMFTELLMVIDGYEINDEMIQSGFIAFRIAWRYKHHGGGSNGCDVGFAPHGSRIWWNIATKKWSFDRK